MKHLLNARGTALTECDLTTARRDAVTTELVEMTCPSCKAALINRGVCPECGQEKLSWTTGPVNIDFHLRCEGCSATLIDGIGPHMVVAVLNEHRWRP